MFRVRVQNHEGLINRDKVIWVHQSKGLLGLLGIDR